MFSKPTLTKSQAVSIAKNKSALARALHITPAAVSQWKDERIPHEHYQTLRYELAPWAFTSTGKIKANLKQKLQ